MASCGSAIINGDCSVHLALLGSLPRMAVSVAVAASPVLEVRHESTVPDACVAEAHLNHANCMSEVPFHLFKITLKSNLQ